MRLDIPSRPLDLMTHSLSRCQRESSWYCGVGHLQTFPIVHLR
jgi:hypothetical protein